MPVKFARFAADSAMALFLCVSIMLGGVMVSRQFRESRIYRQSMIIGSIYNETGSDSLPGWSGLLTDPRSRNALIKFAGAVASAYVTFELIPVNEAETFAVIYESMPTDMEIGGFAYHRRDLTITGTAAGLPVYLEFLDKLREREYFLNVTGSYIETTGNAVRFEIGCFANDSPNYNYNNLKTRS